MANNKNSNKNSEFKGFVNLELDKSQLAEQKKWKPSELELITQFFALIGEGYSASIKFDTFNECYQCALGSHEDCEWGKGWFLTGRGSTPGSAVKQALFKHFNVCGEDWRPFMGSARNSDYE